MKTNFVLAGIFLSCSLGACQPQSPTTPSSTPAASAKVPQKALPAPSIKGVQLGDSLASVKAKYSNALCPGDPDKDETGCIINGISYATAEGMMVVSFVHGKAVSITIRNIEPQSFETVSSALIAKLGEPNSTYAQLFGMPPGSLAWGGSNWAMIATRDFDRGKSGVLLVDRAYMEKSLAEHKEKAESDL